MRCSVLMSVYKNDNASYLKLALESIYDKQKLKPDEIVVVFDGPLTDELYKVLDSFKKGKENIVKYLPQEVNRGLGEALRIGSEACTGNYILRMDSDDISDGKRFEEQIAFMAKHPEIDVVGTAIAEFKNDPCSEKLRLRINPSQHEAIVKMIKRRNPMNHVTTCIRKSALLKAGGYKPHDLLEDYLLWLHMMGCGCKFANINKPLVYVRVGNGFTHRRGEKAMITGWSKLQDAMLDYGMINRLEAFENKVYIRLFVYTPAWLKDILYNIFLRK